MTLVLTVAGLILARGFSRRLLYGGGLLSGFTVWDCASRCLEEESALSPPRPVRPGLMEGDRISSRQAL